MEAETAEEHCDEWDGIIKRINDTKLKGISDPFTIDCHKLCGSIYQQLNVNPGGPTNLSFSKEEHVIPEIR